MLLLLGIGDEGRPRGVRHRAGGLLETYIAPRDRVRAGAAAIIERRRGGRHRRTRALFGRHSRIRTPARGRPGGSSTLVQHHSTGGSKIARNLRTSSRSAHRSTTFAQRCPCVRRAHGAIWGVTAPVGRASCFRHETTDSFRPRAAYAATTDSLRSRSASRSRQAAARASSRSRVARLQKIYARRWIATTTTTATVACGSRSCDVVGRDVDQLIRVEHRPQLSVSSSCSSAVACRAVHHIRRRCGSDDGISLRMTSERALVVCSLLVHVGSSKNTSEMCDTRGHPRTGRAQSLQSLSCSVDQKL